MAELKRGFAAGKMNKDFDERLVPDGQYRDALNIQINTSDGSDVGAAQTLRGNTKHDTMVSGSGYYGIPDTATVVGSIANAATDKVYYFVTDGATDIKKDYILEYDLVTEKIKYVFVDIWKVTEQTAAASSSSDNFLYIPVLTIADVTSSNQNITGVRIGMKVTFDSGSLSYNLDDDVRVSDIIFDSGQNRYKIYLEQDGASFTPANGVAESAQINFFGGQVLNFSSHEGENISAINIVDDMIYWTDGRSEPKKINITRCILGTGGTEYAVGGGVDGWSSTSTENTWQTFQGDTPFFHTRLVEKFDSFNSVDDDTSMPEDGMYRIAFQQDRKRVVWMDESHVTVIKKAPTEPLSLDMYRSKENRSSGGEVNPVHTEHDTLSFINEDTEELYVPGDPIEDVYFDSPVDFREGDTILFARQEDAPNATTFEDYSVRCLVTSDGGAEPWDLQTGPFNLEILSISSSLLASDTKWYVRLEEAEPLFEFKFPRFSYRYKYEDGEYSTFAPWSEIAFLPGRFEYQPKEGYNIGMTNQIRKLVIRDYIPADLYMPEDVVAVDILYKETNNPTVYSVRTITPEDAGKLWPVVEGYYYDNDERGEYVLETDLIHAVLPSNQILRPWDNVPVNALAQEITANRLVFGNYRSGYDVRKEPQFTVGYSSKGLDNVYDGGGRQIAREDSVGSDFAWPSVKTMRTYQIGLVWSDRYGRETPVLTAHKAGDEDTNSWASVHVPKEHSHYSNRLTVQLNSGSSWDPPNGSEIPSWAEFYSWYVKETTTEYYNMAMDRWYDAEDGNVWISFPSCERNKIDEESYITLKKAHGSDRIVHDRARYKVIAIENEAPDFIKEQTKSLGIVWNNADKTDIGNSTRGYPLQDHTFILVDSGAFEDAFGDTETWISYPDKMTVRLLGAGQVSEEYLVTNLAKIGSDYKIKIEGKFEDDAGFASTDDTWSGRIVGLGVELLEKKIENKPEYVGRFFVKIRRDHVLQQYVLSANQEADYIVKASWQLRYLCNNGYGNAYWAEDSPGYQQIYPIPEDAKEWGFSPSYATNAQHVYHDDGGDFRVYDWWCTTGAQVREFDNVLGESAAKHPTQYSHHGNYWWADQSEGSVPGNNAHGELKNKHMHMSPILSINDGNADGDQADEFWLHMAGKQDFFIDACTAFSWEGHKTPGGYFGGNIFVDGGGSNYPSTWSNADVANDKEEGAPDWEGHDTCFANMKKDHGMPSRGIWNGGSCIDISWTGMGEGYDGSNWSDKPFPQRLQDVGGDIYEAAARFIELLATPGTMWRFQKDPDEVVYTSEDFANYPTFGYPAPGTANSFFKSGTNYLSGAFGIRNWSTAGSDKKQYYGHNIRQRWTIMVTPEIGSGPSGYMPTTGTNANAETQVPALKHDAWDADVIEIVERYYDPESGKHFSKNPAIWETEPKEDVELDIYWEASPKCPLYLTPETKENFVQRGDTFVKHTDINNPEAQVYKVLRWSNGSADSHTFDFTTIENWPSGPSSQYGLTEGMSKIALTRRGRYTRILDINTASANDTSITLRSTGSTWDDIQYNPIYSKQYLDWSNCWSFGNGVESDRIRDDFNQPQLDNGVKASATIAEPIRRENKKNGLIWSGMYNDTANVNNLNQFIAGENITKDLNPAHGSIQALVNRETRVAIFCEDRVLRAETNRDLLYNADGNPQVVASNAVIGDVVAYQGNYGISDNPESLAVTPYRCFFTDRRRGVVLQLTTEGITPISSQGMIDYFGDIFDEDVYQCLGLYDENKKEYNLSIKKKYSGYNHHPGTSAFSSTTLAWSEMASGWASFRSYVPEDGVTINNKFFTFYNGHVWKHHAETAEDSTTVPRNNFYGTQYTSNITIPFNAEPESVKGFTAINYEGSIAKITNFDTEDAHAEGTTNDNWLTGVYSSNNGIEAGRTVTDGEYYNIEDTVNGWYVESINTNLQECGTIEFKNKEGKYYGQIAGVTTTLGNLDEREFSVQGLGSATILHSNPSLGASGAITVANNTSTTYEGSDGSGGAWDSTADSGNWTVTSNTFDATIGVAESAQQVDLTITGSTSDGILVQASNFKIGGATESPTNTWTGGNVDSPIAKVVFSDNGDPVNDAPNNTVNAKVYLDAYTPANLNTLYVDIDEGTRPPSATEDRVACFKVITPYTYHDSINSNQTITVENITDPVITETVQNDGTAAIQAGLTSGGQGHYITVHQSEVVQSDTTNLLAKYTFTAATNYYYSNNMSVDDYVSANYNPGQAFPYDEYYSTDIEKTFDADGNVSSFIVRVYYHPPNIPELYPDPALSDFCKMNHHFIINYNLRTKVGSVVVEEEPTLQGVSMPVSALPYNGGEYPIIVKGTKDTDYNIRIVQTTSTSSGIPATSGYYDWVAKRFTTEKTKDENLQSNKLDKTRKAIHRVSFPQVTSDTRYDIYIEKVNLTTGKISKLNSRVPIKAGDLSITQYGVNTLTLACTPQAPSSSDYTTANLSDGSATNKVVKRPKRFDGDLYTSVKYRQIDVATDEASSNSTRLLLEKSRQLNYIKRGYYAIGEGIPHLTKVDSIIDRVVTLSAAATVPIYTEVKFVKDCPSIIPFEFKVTPSSNVLFVKDKERTVNQANATTNKIIFDQENYVSDSDQIRVGDLVHDSDGTLHGTVTALNPDSDNTKEIQISASAAITNNETLYISTKNRIEWQDRFVGFSKWARAKANGAHVSADGNTLDVDSSRGVQIADILIDPETVGRPLTTTDGSPKMVQLGLVTAVTDTQITVSNLGTALSQDAYPSSSIADDQELLFYRALAQTSARPVYMTAEKVGNDIIISGYLRVSDVDKTSTIGVYIDDIITAV